MCTTSVGSLPPKEDAFLKGMLNVGQLKELARLGKIDTVVVGLTDCYGRLVGKRQEAYSSFVICNHFVVLCCVVWR